MIPMDKCNKVQCSPEWQTRECTDVSWCRHDMRTKIAVLSRWRLCSGGWCAQRQHGNSPARCRATPVIWGPCRAMRAACSSRSRWMTPGCWGRLRKMRMMALPVVSWPAKSCVRAWSVSCVKLACFPCKIYQHQHQCTVDWIPHGSLRTPKLGQR